jgi:hypothetical protein
MRDVGIFVWVVLLMIGVGGSMVSSMRKQLAAAQPRQPGVTRPPGPPRRPAPAAPSQRPAAAPQSPPVQQARPQPPRQAAKPAPAARPPAPEAAPEAKPARLAPAAFLRNRSDLVRAVIAAEVLGKPRALRDE